MVQVDLGTGQCHAVLPVCIVPKRLPHTHPKIYIRLLKLHLDFFCKKNNINYFLDYGTLLGAIRHKGYIPWDDDIDVGMLRKDFDKFIVLFDEQVEADSRYKIIGNEIQSDCYYPFVKIIDTKTILYEPDEKGFKSGVNIDVFVYDSFPSKEVANKQFRLRDKLMNLNIIQFKMFRSTKTYRKLLNTTACYVLKLFPRGYFSSKIVELSKRYADTDAEFIGSVVSGTSAVCHKCTFDGYINKEFEGRMYPVPIGYDTWLTEVYGEYMKLPPEEKRIPHHLIKAYIKS